MAERGPQGRSRRRRASPGEAVERLWDFVGEPGADLLIGLGNSLRGDDGVGGSLVAWAQRRWPQLRGRAVQQLTPELSCELATARRVLFVDAWCAGGGRVEPACSTDPIAAPPGPDAPGLAIVGRSAPLLLPLRPASAAGAASTEAGAFSHRLDPAQLLAITALLHDREPQAWLLLVPAFRFAHGEGLSPALQAQLPAAEALLRRWCCGEAAAGRLPRGCGRREPAQRLTATTADRRDSQPGHQPCMS